MEAVTRARLAANFVTLGRRFSTILIGAITLAWTYFLLQPDCQPGTLLPPPGSTASYCRQAIEQPFISALHVPAWLIGLLSGIVTVAAQTVPQPNLTAAIQRFLALFAANGVATGKLSIEEAQAIVTPPMAPAIAVAVAIDPDHPAMNAPLVSAPAPLSLRDVSPPSN